MSEKELRAEMWKVLLSAETGTEFLCPSCKGPVSGGEFDEHQPGCELAYLLYVELKEEWFKKAS